MGNRLVVSALLILLPTVASTQETVKANGSILKPLIISAHRAGGRVFAPDNSEPNIEHAVAIGVNMIEIDLRPTADGHLVLWHDASAPRSTFFPGDTSQQRVVFHRLTMDDVNELRYTAVTGGREWKGLAVVDADTVIERYKNRLNFHLDVKSTPADRVLQLIAEHDIRDRVIVMSEDLEYIRTIKKADPGIICEWPQNTLGRHQVNGEWVFYSMDRQLEEYHRAMRALREVGGDMLCTKGLTAKKVGICHQYGIAVRPSVGNVQEGGGITFLRMGVDGILSDNPAAVMEAVQTVLGKGYLPGPGQSVAEIFGLPRGASKSRQSVLPARRP